MSQRNRGPDNHRRGGDQEQEDERRSILDSGGPVNCQHGPKETTTFPRILKQFHWRSRSNERRPGRAGERAARAREYFHFGGVRSRAIAVCRRNPSVRGAAQGIRCVNQGRYEKTLFFYLFCHFIFFLNFFFLCYGM